jgi:hypothetical protein
MNKYSTPFYKIYDKVVTQVAAVNWSQLKAKVTGKRYYNLTDADLAYIKKSLKDNYLIILTRRKTHLTTYLIEALSLAQTGLSSYWTHALMNMEGDNPIADGDFRLMEATQSGVHWSNFMQVFDCDAVALLKPKYISLEDWTAAIDKMVSEAGKPYDDLFDLADDTHLSCVELVRTSLMNVPAYASKFSHFEEMIKNFGNLTPQMYYNCQDFEVIWEIRR